MSNEVIDDILDNFDFEKVKDAMDTLEWKYWDSEEKTITIYELRKMARYLLKSAYKQEPSEYWVTGSGGFEVERRMYVGDPKVYLTLKFVVEEVSNEH